MAEQSVAGGKTRLTDEDLGRLFRRLTDMKRQLEQGSLSLDETLKGLQAILEGKAKNIGKPCQRLHRSEAITFNRPCVSERRRSVAPMRKRLPKYLNRLYWCYKMMFSTGKRPHSDHGMLLAEDIMAQMWEAENIPEKMINGGLVPVQAILDNMSPSDREVAIVSSTLQWLGTNVGKDFLRRFVLTSKIYI